MDEDDIATSVLVALDSPAALARVALVSRRLRALSKLNLLWKPLCQRRWSGRPHAAKWLLETEVLEAAAVEAAAQQAAEAAAAAAARAASAAGAAESAEEDDVAAVAAAVAAARAEAAAAAEPVRPVWKMAYQAMEREIISDWPVFAMSCSLTLGNPEGATSPAWTCTCTCTCLTWTWTSV